jgi:hypothetical protein
MRKFRLIGLLILIAVVPSVVLAGNIYWNATADFGNESEIYTSAWGEASVSYSKGEWAVNVEFTNLKPSCNYIFQFGIQNQLANRADYPITSDGSGNIGVQWTMTDLVEKLGKRQYSIIRIIDPTGYSGGMLLDALEPDGNKPEDDPYEGTPATMVMRAREDGYSGLLLFSPAKGKGKK